MPSKTRRSAGPRSRTVDILPGDHLGMLDPDRLPTLAARLLDRLAASPAGPGSTVPP